MGALQVQLAKNIVPRAVSSPPDTAKVICE